MKPIAGLNRDVNPIDQPPNTMRYAANGVISESTGLAQNIRTELLHETFGVDFTFVGHAIGEHDIYVFGTGTGNTGEIWKYNPEVPSSAIPVIFDPGNLLELNLNADVNKILQIVYQQDFEEHEVFAWAGESKPRIIDIGQVIEDNGNVIPADLDVIGYKDTEFMLFPEGKLFNPDITAIDGGGNVISGAWMLVYRYLYPDQSVTSFSGVSNPVYISRDSFNINQSFSGDKGNETTNKSIKVDFLYDSNQNADTVRVQFGYISIREDVIYAGILNSKGLKSMIIDANTASYVYTGEAPLIDLGDNILELITPKALYNKIGTLTSLTARLYAANLDQAAEVNIQTIANDIKSGWSVIPFGANNKGANFNQPTFGAGEVYALYISILYSDGKESRAFHIPGKKYKVGDDDDIGIGEIDAGTERWQLFDTNDLPSIADGTGYWINEDEFYPDLPEFNSAEDTTGPYLTNVRHHKMPSMGYLIENGHSDSVNFPRLSIELYNIDLSSLGTDVIGYNIYYAKRKIGEFINYCYDWPTPTGKTPNSGQVHVAIAGSFGYSDEVQGTLVDPLVDVVPGNEMLRFHSLFLLKDKPSINPLYVAKEARTIIAKVTPGLNVDSDVYTDIAAAEVTLLSAYKYGKINGLQGVVSIPVEVDRYSKINDFSYVKNGANISMGSSDSINNRAGEDAFIVYNNSVDGFDGVSGLSDVLPVAVERFENLAETTLTLAALRAVPSNISTPFTDQILNFCGSFKRNDGSSEIATINSKHGDTYNGLAQFNTTGVAGMYDDPLGLLPEDIAVIDTTTDEAGIFKGESSKMVYSIPSQSPINHTAQYVLPGDFQSLVYPIEGSLGPPNTIFDKYNGGSIQDLKSWYFYDMNIYQSMNYFYSSDFHRRSEYFIRGINDGYFNNDSKSPFTIGFSLQQATNIQTRQWRNWLIENKYVQPSEKGKIINLKGAGNQMLYIHHRYSLYTTKDRISMQTDSVSVIIGSSDIFQVTPYEIVSVDEGHTGLKNRNWHSLSPFGYSWMQTDHGKIYMHDGKSLEEMSGVGLRTYFRDFLFDDDNRDEACYIINDDIRRRMVVGFRHQKDDKAIGRTISFSTTGRFWSFFQDMETVFPLISRDKRVFMWGKGVNENSIYALAEGSYDNDARPFIVEVVMNDGTSAHKYLQFLKWNTNVFSNNLDVEDQTFNKLVIYSDSKIYGAPGTGPHYWDSNLVPYIGFPRGTQNTRRLEDNWATNTFRDLWDGVTNILSNAVDNNGPNSVAINTGLTWDKKGRMRDKYLIVRLYYETPNGNKFEFENIEFGIKPSFR